MSEASTYVYAISMAPTTYIKVGIARDPWKRLATLQTANPGKLKIERLWGPFPREKAFEVEHAIHDFLSEDWTNGEWFNVPADDVTFAVFAVCDPDPAQKQAARDWFVNGACNG